MKELFQGPNQTDKIIEDATLENLDEPDWAIILIFVTRSMLKRLTVMLKSPRIQYLALVLLETCVKNCKKALSEVAAERVLDEMVKLIEDPQTVVNNRDKALMLIESWGESSNELRYLPVYEETYKIKFLPEAFMVVAMFIHNFYKILILFSLILLCFERKGK
ncbi:tom1-like protein 1 [Quercus suber]|uniref:Tom1-like protein 1 n=1 Tax=Quercus suber TaxID=58331 RepID=A0AAW0JA22_QUESU